MNACIGLWKCGKSRAFPTFPQPLFFLFLNSFPKKITIKRGEGNKKAAKEEKIPVLGLYPNKLLTLQIKIKGVKYEEKTEFDEFSQNRAEEVGNEKNSGWYI